MRYYDTPIGQLPSVTTILAVLEKPWMIPWIKKLTRQNVAAGMPLDEALDSHKAESEKALKIGSTFHSMIETYYKAWNGPIESYVHFIQSYMPPMYGEMLTTFFVALYREGLEILESEMTVYSIEGYAGTLDTIARKDTIKLVGDYKTGKTMRPEYAFQLAAYRHALPYPVDKAFCLRFDKEPPYSYEIKYYDDFETDIVCFRQCQVAFEALQQIPKIRREAKARRKSARRHK